MERLGAARCRRCLRGCFSAVGRKLPHAHSSTSRFLLYFVVGVVLPVAISVSTFSANYEVSLVAVAAWSTVFHAAAFYDFVQGKSVLPCGISSSVLLVSFAVFIGLYGQPQVLTVRPAVTFGRCQSIRNSSLVSCPNINYVGTTGLGSGNLTISQLDLGSATGASVLQHYWTVFPQFEACHKAVDDYLCHALFPQCNSQCRRLPLCFSECVAVNTICSTEFALSGLDFHQQVAVLSLYVQHSQAFDPHAVVILSAAAQTLISSCRAPLPNATNYRFDVNNTIPLAIDSECIGAFDNVQGSNCSYAAGNEATLAMEEATSVVHNTAATQAAQASWRQTIKAVFAVFTVVLWSVPYAVLIVERCNRPKLSFVVASFRLSTISSAFALFCLVVVLTEGGLLFALGLQLDLARSTTACALVHLVALVCVANGLKYVFGINWRHRAALDALEASGKPEELTQQHCWAWGDAKWRTMRACCFVAYFRS